MPAVEYPDTLTSTLETELIASDLKSEQRRERIVETASTLFNRYGVGGVSLTQIADILGLSRPAIYYYANNKNALVKACYLRTCSATQEEIELGRAAGGTGLHRLSTYLRYALCANRPEYAVLTDVGGLAKADQAEVTSAISNHLEGLQEMIEQGIEDESLRSVDSRLAAMYVLGLVWWLPIARYWSPPAQQATTEEVSIRDAARELILYGISTEGHFVTKALPGITPRQATLMGAFSRESLARIKRDEFVRAACRCFNRHGIHGASLEKIAANLDVTTGAFYRQFADKGELLEACYRHSLARLREIAIAGGDTGSTGAEKAANGVYLNAIALLSGDCPLMPSIGTESHDARAHAEFMAQSAEITAIYETYLGEGIRDGSIRPLDCYSTTIAGVGAFVWISKWKMDFPLSEAKDIAKDIRDIFLFGLGRSSQASSRRTRRRLK